jgi:hypothetical protein
MPDGDVDLSRYRDKWREAPQGSDTDGRIFSSDLLRLGDAELLVEWDRMAERRYAGEIGWVGPLYFDTFRGRKVIELGAGLGFDGLRFAANGASWTFTDIVPDNLELIRRVARLKQLGGRVAFSLIGDDLSFATLPYDYDAVWAFGSLHHVPFEIARREAHHVLGHLKPGGRWMELVYPRQRWLREGAPPFEHWGKITDGERTPWAEWHDLEKVKRRLSPAPIRVLLDFEFCGNNYRWLDLQYAADKPFRPALHDIAARDRAVQSASCDLRQGPIVLSVGARRRLPWRRDWSFVAPQGLFAEAAHVDLKALSANVAVDLEIGVTRGAVGVGLMARSGSYIPGAETVVEEGRHSSLVTLRATGEDIAARLVFRNLDAAARSRFEVHTAVLRPLDQAPLP